MSDNKTSEIVFEENNGLDDLWSTLPPGEAIAAEARLFTFAEQLTALAADTERYRGGQWATIRSSTEFVFYAPIGDRSYHITGDGERFCYTRSLPNDGRTDGKTVGVIATLALYSDLSIRFFQRSPALGQWATDRYHLLRDSLIIDDGERAALVLAAID